MNRQLIISLLYRYRSLNRRMVENTNAVLDHLAAFDRSRYMVYPCDIIDLRPIFKDSIIESLSPICLFSLRFAEKYLRDYSVLLVIDSEKIAFEAVHAGGMMVYMTDSLDVEDKLIRVIVNSPTARDYFGQVKKLVEEYKMPVEVLQSSTIPGVDTPVARVAAVKKKKYVAAQTTEIGLSETERAIFDLLVRVKREYNLPTGFRVAGGWVRDKLLGRESDDIDIAVAMPGYEVAKLVEEFGQRHGLKDIGSSYRVSLEKVADPADKSGQSPDLMVGAVSVYGIKIEFVPMRTESYPDPNSRQPMITPTKDPKEDVKRRDLTINALLYNVETGQVEDYVGGKQDLGLAGSPIVLRTPDEPQKTFMEDPLRLLRVLRFHSRYPQSVVDPGIVDSLANPDIHEAYRRKVASERAGPEIMKMLMGQDPVDALRLLFDSGLYQVVFDVPSMQGVHPDGIHMDQQTPYHVHNLKEHTLKVVETLNNRMMDQGEPADMRGIMNLAALFHDFGKMKTQQPHPHNPQQMQYLEHEDHSARMADEILKSIGVGQDKRDMVQTIVSLHMQPHQAKGWSNKARGKFLRRTRPHGKEEAHKDLWKYILYLVEADQQAGHPDSYDEEQSKKIFNDFHNFVNSPSGQATQNTVINGHDVMAVFSPYNLDPRTGYLREVLNTIQEMQDAGEIDMSFITLPEGAEKQNGMEVARAKAIEAVQQMVPQILQRYKGPVMANNWYSKVVQAQAVPQGTLPSSNDPEIVRGPEPQDHRYEVGMKVRDRRKGVANPQEYGTITKICGNKITIVWNPEDKKKRRQQVLDAVEDTEVLSFLVAEV